MEKKYQSPGKDWSIRQAVAQQRLEGLTSSDAIRHDLALAAKGELTTVKVINNISQRIRDAQILKQR